MLAGLGALIALGATFAVNWAYNPGWRQESAQEFHHQGPRTLGRSAHPRDDRRGINEMNEETGGQARTPQDKAPLSPRSPRSLLQSSISSCFRGHQATRPG